MYKLIICLFLTVIFSSGIVAQNIIVETREKGQNIQCYKESTSTWLDSQAKSLVDGVTPGIGSRFLTIDMGSTDATAEVTPNIPSTGKYEIFVTWGMSGNAENVKCTIMIDGKESNKIYINQRGWGGDTPDVPGNGNIWVSLGTYDLPQGDKTKLIISANEVTGKANKTNSGRLYADAFKFSPPSSQSTSTTTSSTPAKPSGQTAPITFVQPQQVQSSPFSQISEQVSSPFDSSIAPTTPQPSSPFSSPSPSPQQTPTPAPPFQPLGPINWLYDYYQAIKEGIRLNQPILLFFCSETGRLSTQLESQVLSNPDVVPHLQKFVCCKIKITDENNIKYSEYYEVFKAPTLIFLNPQGFMKGREDRSLDVKGMIDLLQKMK